MALAITRPTCLEERGWIIIKFTLRCATKHSLLHPQGVSNCNKPRARCWINGMCVGLLCVRWESSNNLTWPFWFSTCAHAKCICVARPLEVVSLMPLRLVLKLNDGLHSLWDQHSAITHLLLQWSLLIKFSFAQSCSQKNTHEPLALPRPSSSLRD